MFFLHYGCMEGDMNVCTHSFYQYLCDIYTFPTAKVIYCLLIETFQVYLNRTKKKIPHKYPYWPRKIINSFSSVWMNRYIFRIISLNAHFYLSHLLRMLCSVADVSWHDTWAWNLSVWYLWWWNLLMKCPSFQLVVVCSKNLADFEFVPECVIKNWNLLFSEISQEYLISFSIPFIKYH